VALGRAHPVRRTPLLATALVAPCVLVLALRLPLVTLAKATSLITLIAFSLTNLALLRIKHCDQRPAGIRIYPLCIPLAGFLSSSVFVPSQLGNL
jgi:amino acid transporter